MNRAERRQRLDRTIVELRGFLAPPPRRVQIAPEAPRAAAAPAAEPRRALAFAHRRRTS